MTATIRVARFYKIAGGPEGNQNTVVCWETAATAAAATAWRCSAVQSMRASLTLQNQIIITNDSETETKGALTVGGVGFQLQLAGASWRVDPGSSRGT